MSDNKMIDKINDAIEEAIRPILGKGAAMNAAELEVLMKSICALEKIQQMQDGEKYSEQSRNSYNSYNSYGGQGSYNNAPNSYGVYDNYSNGDVSRFYRDDNSYRRGRSATTGRYVSRDDGYSTRRYYDGGERNNGGYSGHSIKDRMVAQLEKMYDEAQTEHERQYMNNWIRLLENFGY